MIEDVIISVGRVGTLATWHFLRSAPDVTPMSWFDTSEIARHWHLLDEASQRFVVMIHNPAHLPLLNSVPSERLRLTWATRCPFASARSMINWHMFQQVVLSDGRPERPWSQIANFDALTCGYTEIIKAVRGLKFQIIDFHDFSLGQALGYEKLAQHHLLPLENMSIPKTIQSGLFEAFLCNFRFSIGSMRYLLVPAEDISWEGCDLFLGYIPAKDVFPEKFGDGRLLSAYVAMDRPDSQWKREFALELLNRHKGELAERAYDKFNDYQKVFSNWSVPEDDPELDEMVNRAFSYSLGDMAKEYPIFLERWSINKIRSPSLAFI